MDTNTRVEQGVELGLESAVESLLERAVRVLAVATEITTIKNPEDVPLHVVRCLMREFGLQAASVLRPDPSTGELCFVAEMGVPPEVRHLGFRPSGTAWTVFKSGEPQFVENVVQDRSQSSDISTYFQSYACLPLEYRKSLLGLLFVNYKDPHVFDAMERQILITFASQTAAALGGLTGT
ncbi:MAG: GAF domain-containing protein, partial [Holophaga sp.]|nr:GAF domain-containing protein [Holophaga sp.]